MQILLTGGAGYIGAHVALVLLNAGHDVIVFDNLSNGSHAEPERVDRLAGRGVAVEQGGIGDTRAPGDLSSVRWGEVRDDSHVMDRAVSEPIEAVQCPG
mgnify:FL=1